MAKKLNAILHGQTYKFNLLIKIYLSTVIEKSQIRLNLNHFRIDTLSKIYFILFNFLVIILNFILLYLIF